MDRNDYYGGESTSLNLIQVLFPFQISSKPSISFKKILITQTTTKKPTAMEEIQRK